MNLSQNDQALETIEEAENIVINAISETMDLYGVTPSTGQLYATMYFKEEMTLDEMRDELGMSKPSMSTGVRKLQEIEMVKKVFQRGSRKHNYIAEKDFFHSFISYFCQMWDREANTNMAAIRQAQILLNEVIKDSSVSSIIREDAEKKARLLEDSKKYYRWLKRLVKSIRSGEIYEFLPKDPPETN
ncbi:choline uptake/conversion transcriptional regulator CudC [Pseudogracilibacillus auburnensis]|uniref:HTH-type transcriptional regulator n=1 Tax=Pseudogracilibacillus auburnensis TaxID=1494959 RepID=A0A2V3VLC4_9BACI|nr:GbsR/MarR family transcriptional regulator [Pseudogracilibacillus auburnensis]MBO1002546.1 GbsR/MarR family transcriptional regulator [Pseudogracilibacillus auburnensis]PXW82612.1 DNA-binding transcriptional regulator GbsR (MarR family) [Pseudogracilibacillus auburnensis]